MIDATAGRDDLTLAAASNRTLGDGAVDPAWRGVWQSAMERTQVQSWFHASPHAGKAPRVESQAAPAQDGGSRPRPAASEPPVAAHPGAYAADLVRKAEATLPITAYVDARAGAASAKTTFGETAYAAQSPLWPATLASDGHGELTAEATVRAADVTSRAQALVRDAVAVREMPVRWHVSLSDGVVNVWLGVSASHADMVKTLVPLLREAMRREGIQAGTMTVNGLVLQAQNDTHQVAEPARAAPRR